MLERLRTIPHAVIGVGGTVTTLGGGSTSDWSCTIRIESTADRLLADRVRVILVDLLGRSLVARQTIPGSSPAGADVIVAGALVLQRVLDGLGGRAIQASEADLLGGAAGLLAGPRRSGISEDRPSGMEPRGLRYAPYAQP